MNFIPVIQQIHLKNSLTLMQIKSIQNIQLIITTSAPAASSLELAVAASFTRTCQSQKRRKRTGKLKKLDLDCNKVKHKK